MVWTDEPAPARTWRDAQPFSHPVLDDVPDGAGLAAVVAMPDDEAVEHYASDIFAFDASAPEPATPEFRELRDGFASALAPILTRITGKPLCRADMRAYAYRPGHYLLPHTDHQDGLRRVLAYAY